MTDASGCMDYANVGYFTKSTLVDRSYVVPEISEYGFSVNNIMLPFF